MSTKIFLVQNNKIHFKCPSCAAKSYIAVPGGTRRRSVRCQKCSARTQCVLNRRTNHREAQAGKCLLIIDQGKEMEIHLHDISVGGLGFDLPIHAARALSLRQEIRFKCTWNPTLLTDRFIVKSINGRRIGAEKT